MIRWLLLLLSLPCFAQYRELRLEFQGTDCASCNASLPDRLKRIRGVESVALEGHAVVLKLAAENRVRLEQIRDLIEQDGTKVKSAVLVAKGVVKADGTFTVGATEFKLKLPEEAQGRKANFQVGEAELGGRVSSVRAPLILEVVAHP